MKRLALLALCGALTLPACASDPAEALGKAPWPGMTAWDAAWCRDLVARAGFVELRVLFTYGSEPVEGVSEYRDAPPR